MLVNDFAGDVSLEFAMQAFHGILVAKHARKASGTGEEWKSVLAKFHLEVCTRLVATCFESDVGEYQVIALRCVLYSLG